MNSPVLSLTMTLQLRTALWVALAGVLSACADLPANAPIEDRTAPRPSAAAAVENKSTPAADPPGFYTVKKGDTLSRIAQQFGQPWRDLQDWNKLSNPNDIKLGQQLRVLPPEGARLTSVPDSDIEIKPLEASTASEPAPAAVSNGSALRATGGLKSGPLGNKVAYSEQAWADAQRSDVTNGASAPSAPSAPSASLNEAARSGAVSGRFIWPTDGRPLQAFDVARKGIDIAGQAGQPVRAAGDGKILYAKPMRGYGNLVIVDHGDGLISAYGHNQTIRVTEGQTVTRGQQIAEMGNTDAESVKLHFEIRQGGKPVDPAGYLPSR
jgi:lipoprotein NlpD